MAKRLGIPESTLHRRINDYEKRHGLKPSKTFYPEEEKRATVQKAIPLLQEGRKIVEIAKILEVNYNNLRRWLREYGPDYGLTTQR